MEFSRWILLLVASTCVTVVNAATRPNWDISFQLNRNYGLTALNSDLNFPMDITAPSDGSLYSVPAQSLFSDKQFPAEPLYMQLNFQPNTSLSEFYFLTIRDPDGVLRFSLSMYKREMYGVQMRYNLLDSNEGERTIDFPFPQSPTYWRLGVWIKEDSVDFFTNCPRIQPAPFHEERGIKLLGHPLFRDGASAFLLNSGLQSNPMYFQGVLMEFTLHSGPDALLAPCKTAEVREESGEPIYTFDPDFGNVIVTFPEDDSFMTTTPEPTSSSTEYSDTLLGDVEVSPVNSTTLLPTVLVEDVTATESPEIGPLVPLVVLSDMSVRLLDTKTNRLIPNARVENGYLQFENGTSIPIQNVPGLPPPEDDATNVLVSVDLVSGVTSLVNLQDGAPLLSRSSAEGIPLEKIRNYSEAALFEILLDNAMIQVDTYNGRWTVQNAETGGIDLVQEVRDGVLHLANGQQIQMPTTGLENEVIAIDALSGAVKSVNTETNEVIAQVQELESATNSPDEEEVFTEEQEAEEKKEDEGKEEEEKAEKPEEEKEVTPLISSTAPEEDVSSSVEMSVEVVTPSPDDLPETSTVSDEDEEADLHSTVMKETEVAHEATDSPEVTTSVFDESGEDKGPHASETAAPSLGVGTTVDISSPPEEEGAPSELAVGTDDEEKETESPFSPSGDEVSPIPVTDEISEYPAYPTSEASVTTAESEEESGTTAAGAEVDDTETITKEPSIQGSEKYSEVAEDVSTTTTTTPFDSQSSEEEMSSSSVTEGKTSESEGFLEKDESVTPASTLEPPLDIASSVTSSDEEVYETETLVTHPHNVEPSSDSGISVPPSEGEDGSASEGHSDSFEEVSSTIASDPVSLEAEATTPSGEVSGEEETEALSEELSQMESTTTAPGEEDEPSEGEDFPEEDLFVTHSSTSEPHLDVVSGVTPLEVQANATESVTIPESESPVEGDTTSTATSTLTDQELKYATPSADLSTDPLTAVVSPQVEDLSANQSAQEILQPGCECLERLLTPEIVEKLRQKEISEVDSKDKPYDALFKTPSFLRVVREVIDEYFEKPGIAERYKPTCNCPLNNQVNNECQCPEPGTTAKPPYNVDPSSQHILVALKSMSNGVLIMKNKSALAQVAYSLAPGSMVYLNSEDMFYLKVDEKENIWRTIDMNTQSESVRIPEPIMTTTTTQKPTPSSDLIGKSIMLIAHNDPVNGELRFGAKLSGGHSGAIFACQRAARRYNLSNVFYPLMSTDMFNMDYIVSPTYRYDVPVINIHGQVLFDNVMRLINGEQTPKAPILTFSGKEIDSNPLVPCAWVGAKPIYLNGDYEYAARSKCRNWQTGKPTETGLALRIPMNSNCTGFLDQANLYEESCARRCSVLCIQITPN